MTKQKQNQQETRGTASGIYGNDKRDVHNTQMYACTHAERINDHITGTAQSIQNCCQIQWANWNAVKNWESSEKKWMSPK